MSNVLEIRKQLNDITATARNENDIVNEILKQIHECIEKYRTDCAKGSVLTIERPLYVEYIWPKGTTSQGCAIVAQALRARGFRLDVLERLGVAYGWKVYFL